MIDAILYPISHVCTLSVIPFKRFNQHKRMANRCGFETVIRLLL